MANPITEVVNDSHHTVDAHAAHDAVKHAVDAHDVHAAAAHGTEHAAHELPNLVTILNEQFPDAGWAHFLHQWENVLFSLTAAFLISFLFISAARKKSLVPRGIQNFVEAIVEGLEGFVCGILGEQGRRHIPFLGTIFLYVLLMNWSGLIPLMKSSTAAWSTTIALAVFTMVYVQVAGIQAQGAVHYLKHLAGNPSNLMLVVMAPLMLAINLVIEIVGVPFSLSLRLFANISSEDRLLLNFAQMAVDTKFISFPFQIFANALAIVFSIIQAFVFMLLSTVYIALVMPHDDHGHEDSKAHAH